MKIVLIIASPSPCDIFECKKMRRTKTENWDEGLPLGNGFMGSIVYGGTPLKITADRTDLWDLRPNETTLESGFTYENLKRLVKSGKEEDWQEYRRLFDKIFMGKPYPSKITAGRIEIEFLPKAENVSYELDINSATVTVYDGTEKIAEIFTDSVFATRCTKCCCRTIREQSNCLRHCPKNGRSAKSHLKTCVRVADC